MVLFSFLAAFGFLLVNVVDPYAGATAAPTFNAQQRFAKQDAQGFVVAGVVAEPAADHEGYTVKEPPKPKPKPQPVVASGGSGSSASAAAAPSVPAPSPGSAQAYAKSLLAARGMGDDQYSCLVALWNRESHWNVYAQNPSGAYGIPQALPGSKMASAGPDWQSNYKTQIKWGLSYIGRYGNPCGAWAHSQATGWY